MRSARVVPLVALAAAFATDAGAGDAKTAITVWAAPQGAPAAYGAYGGGAYGGYVAPTGAMVTERRDVEIGTSGEVRITGVAATVDPATVQLRGLAEGAGLSITEQRFVPGATTPDEILARHVGETVTVVTAKGDVIGVLRSVDPLAVVLEVGTGDGRHLQVMRRDSFVQDIRLPAGRGIDTPSLVWRVSTKKPGKQLVEVTYRADGLSWSADYLAIFDETAKTVDFSAWATLRNATGTSFDGAELTLVSGPPAVPNAYNIYGTQPRQSAPAMRFVVPTLVHVGNGESVQVELMPARAGAKARSVIAYEAMQDLSSNYQAYPATDCAMLNATVPGAGRAEVAVEVDLPGVKQLPDGRVRVFRRGKASADRLEVLAEDQLKIAGGVARVRLAAHSELVGERRTSSCVLDERARTLTEKIEVKLENKGKQAIDVVVREYLWRYPVWRIEPGDESVKGVHAGTQTQEYRVSVPAGGKKSVSYVVTYSGWQH